MKAAVIYATKTGHSKKIADSIAGGIKVPALDIASRPKLDDVDLLFIVGGIYGGKSIPELLEYLRGLDGSTVREAVLVTSCVSKTAKQEEVRKLLAEKNIRVSEEEFTCQGSFLFFGRKHPDPADLENSVKFAKAQYTNYIDNANS